MKGRKDRSEALQRENDLMSVAIKSLARAAISQTKKHFLYKKKYLKAKNVIVKETDKLKEMEVETEEAKSNFYDARAKFLKEKDIREELSEEVQYLAKKNNKVRKAKQQEIDERDLILNRIRSIMNDVVITEQSSSVLSDISFTDINVSGSTGEPTHQKESVRIKELENAVSQLTAQLNQRNDDLKSIKNYLEGESKACD